MTKRLSILAMFVMLLLVVPATPASALCVGVCPPQSQPAPSQPAPSQPAPSQPAPSQPAPSQPASSQPKPSPSSSQTGTAPSQPAPSRAGIDSAGTARILELVNQERTSAGLPPMSARSEAASIAQGHSKAMAERREIWHNDAYFTAAVRERLGAKGLGENVAMNSSVEGAHRGLMNSPGHRANILKPGFTVVGMSVVRDARGVVYVTQNFVEPAAGGAATKATARAAAAAGARRTSPRAAAASAGPVGSPAAATADVAPDTLVDAEGAPASVTTAPASSGSVVTPFTVVAVALVLGLAAFALTPARRRFAGLVPGARPTLATT